MDIFMAFNLALVIVGTTVLLLGILSNYIERSLLSKPLLALIIGVVIGFWFNSPDILTSQLAAQYKIFIEELARITLAIGLMGIALRLPRKSLLNFWRPNATLLGPVMILMWLTSGLIIWGIIKGYGSADNRTHISHVLNIFK
jgi:NhaP-type Na+/H+ or K+/H+ antiporter